MKYVERTILDEPDPGAWPRTVLERSGLLDMVTDPNLDRWTAGLRRATGAAVAAISLLDGESVLVKSLCTTAGPVSFAAKIAVDQSLEAYLVSRSIAPLACRAAHAYLERSIAVEGRVAGLVSLVDDGSRDWTPSDLEMLDDAVAAISTEVRPRPRSPLPEHLVLMEDGARLAGIAIERHQALERLTYDARHDDLTGLPNRARIFEALADALARTRTGHHVAVLFVDLDSLKTLNDSLGHDRADDVIREVGKRLSGAMRGNDFVGRFGGDEFVVVAEGIADQEEAGALGFRLLDAVSEPLPGKGATVEQFVWTRVHGAVLDELRRSDWAPRSLRRWERDINQARERFMSLYGRVPTNSELGDALSISRARLLRFLDDIAKADVGSLNTLVVTEDDTTIEQIDTLQSADRGADPEYSAIREKAIEQFRVAFARLPVLDQEVAVLLHVNGLKLREAGEILGISESRVCQIYGRLKRRLREQLDAQEQLFQEVA